MSEKQDSAPQPCPFCGEVIVHQGTDHRTDELRYKVECMGCLAEVWGFDSPREALLAWNRRWTPSSPGNAEGVEQTESCLKNPVAESVEVSGQKERIVAAAILQDGVVYTGTRHAFIIRDIVLMTGTKPVTGQQGFVTSTGQFVSREIAGEIAMRSGQVTHLKYQRTQLFSEELWDIPSVGRGWSSDSDSVKQGKDGEECSPVNAATPQTASTDNIEARSSAAPVVQPCGVAAEDGKGEEWTASQLALIWGETDNPNRFQAVADAVNGRDSRNPRCRYRR